MHAATACPFRWMSIKISSAVKIKTQVTSHASYFMNKAFKFQINDLSNSFK